ncbi:aldehyde dehydrogenase (NAD+) [Paenibacillus shirakamiensis]|uniref:Aldehyde dehydrogenase n=1 Tax=Paenibacillus shirakamiensis TaxID=1265935 RepID=A0ABS4JFY0_9BACL|nr:aldehyde dehydrogenase [Paenibacillus shirakamiensis]MBP2000625.1 aldehyde dehydrogenase (NAD+) [Paenibacillus shirakamiensis]
MYPAYSQEDIERMLSEHKTYHLSGATLNIDFRIQQLQKLRAAIQYHEKEIMQALYQDLRKSEFESYEAEIGLVLESTRYMASQLKKWAKPKRVKTPLYSFPSRSRLMYEPYGTVLIIGPFNYPFQLLMEPLIGAISAGNGAVLKPSESTPHVSALIHKIIASIYDERYIRVIEGEKETTSHLIHAPFDYIFFTGSTEVGKIVMKAASEHLTPVTLELGGKSPVIVDKTARIDIAAKRIIWGKLMNAGQTCIAPDYVLVHHEIKDALILRLTETIHSFYSSNPMDSPDYGRIVNERQFDRLTQLIHQDHDYVITGGHAVREDLYIEPTLLDITSWDAASMEKEIFGPLLPILTYEKLEDAITTITRRPKPLALYLFTEDSIVENAVLSRVSFGGGCINDTLSHVANPYLPFGGVGQSGMGGYHGKYSFELFSHRKSIVKKKSNSELGLSFPPFRGRIKWLRKLMK